LPAQLSQRGGRGPHLADLGPRFPTSGPCLASPLVPRRVIVGRGEGTGGAWHGGAGGGRVRPRRARRGLGGRGGWLQGARRGGGPPCPPSPCSPRARCTGSSAPT